MVSELGVPVSVVLIVSHRFSFLHGDETGTRNSSALPFTTTHGTQGELLRRWSPPSSAKVARTSRHLEKKRHDLLEEAGTD
jgi:hypothetical protein